jgi:hypothetical protein
LYDDAILHSSILWLRLFPRVRQGRSRLLLHCLIDSQGWIVFAWLFPIFLALVQKLGFILVLVALQGFKDSLLQSFVICLKWWGFLVWLLLLWWRCYICTKIILIKGDWELVTHHFILSNEISAKELFFIRPNNAAFMTSYLRWMCLTQQAALIF